MLTFTICFQTSRYGILSCLHWILIRSGNAKSTGSSNSHSCAVRFTAVLLRSRPGRLFLGSTEFKSSATDWFASGHDVSPPPIRAGCVQGGYPERVADLFETGPTPYSSALGTGAPTSSPDPFFLLFFPDHARD